MIEIYTKAKQLPNCWDEICLHNPIMSRRSLAVIEKANPCEQKYIIFNKQSCIILYKLNIDIFSYFKFSLKIPVQVLGIPCSVSSKGYAIKSEDSKLVEEYLNSINGASIILNTEELLNFRGYVKGNTLPTCKLNVRWSTFEDYLLNLRSHYRYRIKRATKKGKNITITKFTDNSLFTEEMYLLYEKVYYKSEYKLERLDIDFFKLLPSTIYVFNVKDKPAAFIQLYSNKETLYFLFGGIDYSLNHQYDIYMNMRIFILKLAIEGGFSMIEMGQTAEDTKMKLGCFMEKKYMYVRHSNAVIQKLISKFINLLSYKTPKLEFNIFTDDNDLTRYFKEEI